MIQCWRLDGAAQTLVLASDGGVPWVVYWAARLPDDTDLGAVAAAHPIDLTGGQLDALPPVTLCPVAGDSFPGQPGLDIDGIAPRLALVSVDDSDGLVITCAGDGVTWEGRLRVDAATDLLHASASVTLEQPAQVRWLAAPVLPGPAQGDLLDMTGRWCGEFQPIRTPWTPGARLRANPTGRTGHEHLPLVYMPGDGATNTSGPVWALHLGWSGGHRMLAEELPDGRRQIQLGAIPDARPLCRVETPVLYAAHSQHGLNGCAVAFQRHLRSGAARPVHYNCWEAVYFDHKLDELKDIATRAAALGAERFVLDDGWFGRRDDDSSSLGDWVVDRRKYPDGLGPLIDHVTAQGMEFGLWVEPEMVSPDSDLYRAYPDWALGPKDQTLGRGQMVLDMARTQVQDRLFAVLDGLLRAHAIRYLKWDHNRVLPQADPAQTLGTYALLDRLRAAHPGVEIESCASGGGRIDFGVLQRCGRVWLSDSNDALERLRIQHNAALLLPAAVTGSHVGPRRCHTSGRVLDIETRAWVAAQRHMGFEMDPRELTDHEATVLAEVTAWWKANRDWMMGADILRLDSADPAVIAEQHTCASGARFVVFAGQAAAAAQTVPRPLRLTGLDPAARYRVALRGDAPPLSRGAPGLKRGPLTLPGAYLMQHGLTLPFGFPGRIWVIEATAEG